MAQAGQAFELRPRQRAYEQATRVLVRGGVEVEELG